MSNLVIYKNKIGEFTEEKLIRGARTVFYYADSFTEKNKNCFEFKVNEIKFIVTLLQDNEVVINFPKNDMHYCISDENLGKVTQDMIWDFMFSPIQAKTVGKKVFFFGKKKDLNVHPVGGITVPHGKIKKGGIRVQIYPDFNNCKIIT